MTNVLEKFHPNGAFGALFPQLHTHHLQLKYCREHLNMLVRVIILSLEPPFSG